MNTAEPRIDLESARSVARHLGRARARVRDVGSRLDSARILANQVELTDALQLGRLCDFARELENDLRHAPQLNRDRGRASQLFDALYIARDLSNALSHSPGGCRDHADRLADALGLDRTRLNSADLDRALANRGNRSRATTYPVHRHLVRGRYIAWDLTRDLDRAIRACRRSEAKRVVPLAAGLLEAAARLLPVSDRARFAEEYASELQELAQRGAGRRQQLHYALRQLRRALPMGLALRSPRRRSAAP